AFDPKLMVATSSSQAMENAAKAAGLRAVVTFLADRAYDDGGLLVPRRMPGSVVHDRAEVLGRVRRLLTEGVVITHSGKRFATRAQSILLHGDTAGAADLARAIRDEVVTSGAQIVPLSQLPA